MPGKTVVTDSDTATLLKTMQKNSDTQNKQHAENYQLVLKFISFMDIHIYLIVGNFDFYWRPF